MVVSSDEYRFHVRSGEEPDFIELPAAGAVSTLTIPRGKPAARSLRTPVPAVDDTPVRTATRRAERRNVASQPLRQSTRRSRPDWVEVIKRRFTARHNAGYAISIVIHLVILAILSLLLFGKSRQVVVINSAFSDDFSTAASFGELDEAELTLPDVPDAPAVELPVVGSGSSASAVAAMFHGGGHALQGGNWDDFLGRLRQNGLDIVLTFDSTGSMGGEIETVKSQIWRISLTLEKLVPGVRIAVCTYRDHGDEYLVRASPLTKDMDSVRRFLFNIQSGGGGDGPEAVLEGLESATEDNRFRPSARKVVLLFGDAPPHEGDYRRCLAVAQTFHREQGGVVSTVSCRVQIPELADIAEAGGGEAFLADDERDLMRHLVVLIFGSEHREQVERAFNLMNSVE